MKLGVMLNYDDTGIDPIVVRDYVQAIEGHGFDFVTTPEHVVGAHRDRYPGQKIHTSDKAYFEPMVLFGFIAGATTTLELATSILILPQRQTALVAKQAAVLDHLCGGRLRLGVGVGRNAIEYETLHQDFATRGARLEEQVDVLRRLWTEDLVTFDGRWHQLDGVGINPLPVQRPIPIWMGSFVGGTSERVLRRIGEVADGWFPQAAPGEDLATNLQRIRAYATAAGRDPAALGIECVTTISSSETPETWRKTADAFRGHGATHLKVVLDHDPLRNVEQRLSLLAEWRDAVDHA
jgi:probable F420-dependent oxidoreductase